jgi:hypothetical protein
MSEKRNTGCPCHDPKWLSEVYGPPPAGDLDGGELIAALLFGAARPAVTDDSPPSEDER